MLGEGLGDLGFAVDDEDFFGGGLDTAEPAGEFVAVGVAGETAEAFDAGLDGVMLTEDADFFGFFQNVAAQGAEGLVADEEDGAFRAGDVVDQVVLDAAAGAHAGAGDDHGGAADVVDGFGFAGLADQGQAGEAKG